MHDPALLRVLGQAALYVGAALALVWLVVGTFALFDARRADGPRRAKHGARRP